MDRRGFNRRMLLGGAAVATAATSLSAAPRAVSAADDVRTAPAGGEVRHIKLYAEKLADGQMGYGLEKGKASVPGSLIELDEGVRMMSNVINYPTEKIRIGLPVKVVFEQRGDIALPMFEVVEN